MTGPTGELSAEERNSVPSEKNSLRPNKRSLLSSTETRPPVLDVEKLRCSYKDKVILDEVSFQVLPGEFMAVVGPNGCGKTTLVKTILKSLRPHSGTIRIHGEDLIGMSNKGLARRMAAVLQNIDSANLTVREYVLLGRLPFFNKYQFFETQKDLELAEKYIALAGLSKMADAKVSEISGGERQLAAIARALTQEPTLLVMDEPTSHLDITHQVRVLDLVSDLKEKLSLTILVVLHDLNLAAEYADRMVLLDKKRQGVFNSGTPEEVLTEPAIEAVYQTRVKVHPNPVTRKPWIFLVKSSSADNGR